MQSLNTEQVTKDIVGYLTKSTTCIVVYLCVINSYTMGISGLPNTHT